MKNIAMNLEKFGPAPMPAAGDIFAFRLRGHDYHFGRVINVDLMMNDWEMILVYIYAISNKSGEMPGELRKEKLLLPPLLLDPGIWRRGYVKKIENSRLLKDDILAKHCFKDVTFGGWRDEFGSRMPEAVDPCGIWGVAPFTGFDNKISKALGIPEAIRVK